MSIELSPAAQAVINAAVAVTGYGKETPLLCARTAAALRAAAKCLEEMPESNDYSFWCSSHVAGIDCGVEKLLAIAAELEGK